MSDLDPDAIRFPDAGDGATTRAGRWRTVRLLEPHLCPACRFSEIVTVETVSGRSKRMLHCKRLDCDNWDRGEECGKGREG